MKILIKSSFLIAVLQFTAVCLQSQNFWEMHLVDSPEYYGNKAVAADMDNDFDQDVVVSAWFWYENPDGADLLIRA